MSMALLRLPVALTLGAAVLFGAAPASAQSHIENPIAVFNGLDKITARIIAFEVEIDETIQFGSLLLTPRACHTRPPTESPNTTAFIEVEDVALDGEVVSLFDGWVFAESPGLSAIDHPVYDIWLTGCRQTSLADAPADETSDSPDRPAPDQIPLPPPRPF
ncbi:DUF2155 domain-containing protein [Saliniramus fredricksonii]